MLSLLTTRGLTQSPMFSMALSMKGFPNLRNSCSRASIISFTGVIGFIGLVAPHMVRYIVGGDNKFVVPGSILMGAIILVIADVISRSLYGFGNVPIGIVMSFIGAPVFLYLIVRKKSQKEVF